MTSLKDWLEVIEADWPEMNITEATRRQAIESSKSSRYSPLPFRIATGRFPTNEEYANYRQRILETPLP